MDFVDFLRNRGSQVSRKKKIPCFVFNFKLYFSSRIALFSLSLSALMTTKGKEQPNTKHALETGERERDKGRKRETKKRGRKSEIAGEKERRGESRAFSETY